MGPSEPQQLSTILFFEYTYTPRSLPHLSNHSRNVVLVEALSLVVGPNADRSMFEDLRWYRSIEKKVNQHGVDLASFEGSITDLANRLLGEIAYDALKQFEYVFEQEFNGGEEHLTGDAC